LIGYVKIEYYKFPAWKAAVILTMLVTSLLLLMDGESYNSEYLSTFQHVVTETTLFFTTLSSQLKYCFDFSSKLYICKMLRFENFAYLRLFENLCR